MKTTLLVMTLNEVLGMKTIMPQVSRDWCDQIIIVDGGSTDDTIEGPGNRAMNSISRNGPVFVMPITRCYLTLPATSSSPSARMEIP